MGLTLVTAPAELPLLLEQVKDWASVDIADDDALLGDIIQAVTALVEGKDGFLNRALVTQTYDYTMDCWPADGTVRIPRPPLQSVTSITYTDADGASQTLAADQYTAVIDRPVGEVVAAYNVTWPTLRTVPNAVTVRYVAGYGDTWNDVPNDLRLALQQLVAMWYDRREPIQVGTIVADLPFAARNILGKYKVYSFG